MSCTYSVTAGEEFLIIPTTVTIYKQPTFLLLPLHSHPLTSRHITSPHFVLIRSLSCPSTVLSLCPCTYPYLHPYPAFSLYSCPLLVLIFLLSLYCVPVGSLVGAYFIGRQLPYFGPEVYYDVLTSAGTYVRYLMGCDD